MENAVAFRNEAARRGVGFEVGTHQELPRPYFWYDLNSGNMVSSSDPVVVMALVELARKYSLANDYGPCGALLNLVASKTDLENAKDSVYWHRPYYVSAHSEPEKWISLKDWLIANGQDPNRHRRQGGG